MLLKDIRGQHCLPVRGLCTRLIVSLITCFRASVSFGKQKSIQVVLSTVNVRSGSVNMEVGTLTSILGVVRQFQSPVKL